MKLHGYFRCSASHRVRVALNLKQIEVEHAFRHLRRSPQNAPDYLSLNSQGLVATRVTDNGVPVGDGSSPRRNGFGGRMSSRISPIGLRQGSFPKNDRRNRHERQAASAGFIGIR
jgi:hypothetical protein